LKSVRASSKNPPAIIASRRRAIRARISSPGRSIAKILTALAGRPSRSAQVLGDAQGKTSRGAG
jgi:hypothetical protein